VDAMCLPAHISEEPTLGFSDEVLIESSLGLGLRLGSLKWETFLQS
jgi:hypothetical protein